MHQIARHGELLLDTRRPQLEQLLAIDRADANGQIRVSGACRVEGTSVLIAGNGVLEPTTLPCNGWSFAGEVASSSEFKGEITASQVEPGGSILYGRLLAEDRVTRNLQTSPTQLVDILGTPLPGTRVVVEPGIYSNIHIVLPSRISGTHQAPIIIDGRGKVTFTQGSRIDVAGDFVTLRGFRFIRSGASNIRLYGASGRVTENFFDRCGNRPHDSCVMVRGPDAEIDFNEFSRSRSVSVQVRGAQTGTQPTNAYLHHNQFMDISRMSGNGQEPVQIAGPGGQIVDISLTARVESNLFYRADGDFEAVSLKTNDNVVRWNVFKDLDASPNIRGGKGNHIDNNFMIRSRPVRVAGQGNSVSGNLILCPRGNYAIVLGDQRQGYDAATRTSVQYNVILARTAGIFFGSGEAAAGRRARANVISGNITLGAPLIGYMANQASYSGSNSVSSNRQMPIPSILQC